MDLSGFINFFVWLGTLLVGAFLSLVFVLLVEQQRKPHLSIETEENPPVLEDGRKFLRVVVRNERINRALGGFATRQPALMCSAHVTFLHTDNTPVFGNERKMIGRWSGTLEPISVAMVPDVKGGYAFVTYRDPTKATDFTDVPPGGEKCLDIVMKLPDVSGCIGWQNAIIQNPQESPR